MMEAKSSGNFSVVGVYSFSKSFLSRTVEKERTLAGWKSWKEVRAMAKDRDKWRKSSAAICATERAEDR